jgi:hypothetical protein
MRAVVVNDTRPGQHPGCMLVMQQLLNGCHNAGIDRTYTLPIHRRYFSLVKRNILNSDVVIINGEGTMHHDSPGALAVLEAALFAHEFGKPVALINTVWENNNQANALLSCTSLRYARESLSAAEIQKAGFTAKVVPDLVLTCTADILFKKPEKVCGPVIVTDDVCWVKALLLARYAKQHGLRFYRMSPRPSLRSFSAIARWCRLWAEGQRAPQLRLDDINIFRDASMVVTGRFHGVCLAILAQRPFVALSSNTHKIEGLLADAQLGDCATLVKDSELELTPFRQIDEAVHKVHSASMQTDIFETYQTSCRSYAEKARSEVVMMFNEISGLVKEINLGT